MVLTRRRVAAGVLLVCGVPAASRGQGVIDVGPPLGVVTLRVGAADENGFLHDLVDFTNRYGFSVLGRPGGPRVGERDTFLAWYRRDDGVAVLVTDLAGPSRMQAFFYGRKDGTAGDVAAELMQAYERKMASYPAFGPER